MRESFGILQGLYRYGGWRTSLLHERVVPLSLVTLSLLHDVWTFSRNKTCCALLEHGITF